MMEELIKILVEDIEHDKKLNRFQKHGSGKIERKIRDKCKELNIEIGGKKYRKSLKEAQKIAA